MIEIVATSTCGYCKSAITADLDESSTLDWCADGDYGCGAHPLNDDEGTYGHVPADVRAVTLTEEVRGYFNAGNRGAEYVESVRQLASRLKL